MLDLTDLSTPALRLLRKLATREAVGDHTVHLPDLAIDLFTSLEELHEQMNELTRAKLIIVERLGGGDAEAGVLIRAHWLGDPFAHVDTEVVDGA